MGDFYSVDEHLQVIGDIFKSVGISAIIWGVDSLVYNSISLSKTVLA
jgi:hypothetical protein